MTQGQQGGQCRLTVRSRLRERIDRIRAFILEDPCNGGPPNGWSRKNDIPSCGWGLDPGASHSVSFGNDAGEVWISRSYTSEPGQSHWVGHYPAADFRRIARWVLWRWAYGEWFGVRRWLYYRWLRWHLRRWERTMAARRVRS